MGIERVINCLLDPFPFFTPSPAANKKGRNLAMEKKVNFNPLTFRSGRLMHQPQEYCFRQVLKILNRLDKELKQDKGRVWAANNCKMQSMKKVCTWE